MFAVQDSGPGVRTEMRAAIFERFRQGEGGPTRQFGGTGLGLAIAKDFVELHGGSISVTDAPGGGALFQAEVPVEAPEGTPVRKPAAAAPPEADATLKATLEELEPVAGTAVAAGAADPEKPRVLVVEDNVEMNRFVAESLADDFAVEVAFDGMDALDKLASVAPDVIVTDIMMPKMSGDQLASEVRKRRELENVPILVLSAKADDELRIKLLRDGVQDYIVKPFSSVELRVRAMNLAKVKRARELLQDALATQQHDLEVLAASVTAKSRELQTALEAMRYARDEAERASQVKSSFLSMISHELRTPLTTIQLQLDRMDRDRSPASTDAQRKMVAKASAGSHRLLELVESLLDYASMDRGKLTVHPEVFDPAALCADVLEELRPRADRKGLDLALATTARCSFTSDPRLLRLAVVNLVDNAIKFTDPGHVEVTCEIEAGVLRLKVRDTGQGIPAEEQGRIFEAFEQLEQARHKHLPGVGLGLAIVKRITEALGGTIAVRSEVGKGTEFVVAIPEMVVPHDAVIH